MTLRLTDRVLRSALAIACCLVLLAATSSQSQAAETDNGAQIERLASRVDAVRASIRASQSRLINTFTASEERAYERLEFVDAQLAQVSEACFSSQIVLSLSSMVTDPRLKANSRKYVDLQLRRLSQLATGLREGAERSISGMDSATASLLLQARDVATDVDVTLKEIVR